MDRLRQGVWGMGWRRLMENPFVIALREMRAENRAIKGFMRSYYRIVRAIAVLSLLLGFPWRDGHVTTVALLSMMGIWAAWWALVALVGFSRSVRRYKRGIGLMRLERLRRGPSAGSWVAEGERDRGPVPAISGYTLVMVLIMTFLIIPSVPDPAVLIPADRVLTGTLSFFALYWLWSWTTKAILYTFKKAYTVGRHMAFIGHDRRLLGQRFKSWSPAWKKAMQVYIYLPMVGALVALVIALVSKGLYYLLRLFFFDEEISLIDSVGFRLMAFFGIPAIETGVLSEMGRILVLLAFQTGLILCITAATYATLRGLARGVSPEIPMSPPGKRLLLVAKGLEVYERRRGGAHGQTSEEQGDDERFEAGPFDIDLMA